MTTYNPKGSARWNVWPAFWPTTVIVIVGGDGALNDAINGIMNSDAPDKGNISLGIIPNGIGNDFANYWDTFKTTFEDFFVLVFPLTLTFIFTEV